MGGRGDRGIGGDESILYDIMNGGWVLAGGRMRGYYCR